MAKKSRTSKVTGSNKKFLPRIYLFFGISICLIAIYFIGFAQNLNIKSNKYYLAIPKTYTTESLIEHLNKNDLIKVSFTFAWTAKVLNLKKIKPGLYTLNKNWGNLRLISSIENQSPKPYLKHDIKSYRNRSNIVKDLCKKTNLSFIDFYKALNDSSFLSRLELTKESVYALFLPLKTSIPKKTNSYEVIEIIKSNFDEYWTSSRQDGIANSKLNPIEATILSSIVFAETKNINEMPLIAGVYINRLKRGMRLESDPTLVFAKGDFSMHRIYQKHTQSNSHYNTYRKKGLPPGPIGVLNLSALDAVVNYTEHDYIFFCANEDFSGTHVYSETFFEHKKKAIRYRKALNKKNIK
ncbi:MAG: endolytic transglycosylase MltG [Cytophagales bacterium]|nr:MAG: endolytic transglycosylase MltG [Cytophagales bacterium]